MLKVKTIANKIKLSSNASYDIAILKKIPYVGNVIQPSSYVYHFVTYIISSIAAPWAYRGSGRVSVF